MMLILMLGLLAVTALSFYKKLGKKGRGDNRFDL